MSRKVLVISYYWPPASGPGVQRILKFVKYLPEFGWEATVITVKDGSYPNEDQELLKDVPSGLKVIRTQTLEPFSLYNSLQGKKGKSVPVAMQGIKESKSPFQRLAKYIRANYFIPDARKFWRPYARKAALKELETGQYEAIITTGPPHSTHLTGLDLHRETGLPWLADFRDPWTTIYYNRFLPRTEATKRKDKSLEDAVVREASAVVAISATFADQLRDRSDKVHVVLNGYDPSDMPEPGETVNKRFTLGYLGNFKPNQDVPALWQVLSERLKDEPDFANHFRLLMVGNVDAHVEQRMHDMGLGSILERKDFVPHSEAVKLMQGCDALLFIIPESDDNKLILTGKIFEYLAVRRPLFSIGPVGGDADRLLQDTGRSSMLDYQNKEQIAVRLQELYNQWKADGQLPSYSDAGLDKLTRKASTEKLAGILDNICGHGKN